MRPLPGLTMKFLFLLNALVLGVLGAKTVRLKQEDFDDGTYIANEDNVKYILHENIKFAPNPGNDFWPHRPEKDCSGKYCGDEFSLGFFAVMVIDAKNVELDLNDKKMEGSPEFCVRQRFHSIIQLGKTPFITNQGPGHFGAWTSRVENVKIHSGTLGLSSHHGIHGNNVKDVTLHNLVVEQFEMIGIHINGAENVKMKDIRIHNMLDDVPFNPLLSQAIFVSRLMDRFTNEQLQQKYTINNKEKTVQEIKKELDDEIKIATNFGLNKVKDGKSYEGPFKKENTNSNLHDGSYAGGIIVRGATDAGVAIQEFAGTNDKPANPKGSNLKLENIKIEGIHLDPSEWVLLKFVDVDKDEKDTNPYVPHGVVKGPFGDVIHPGVWDIDKDKPFQPPNALSAAQFAACSVGGEMTKSCSVANHSSLQGWIKGTDSLNYLLETNSHKWICNKDAMAHVMKGVVGIRIEDLELVELDDVEIQNLKNVGKEHPDHTAKCPNEKYRGGDAFGIVFGNVDTITTTGKGVDITNIESDHGVAADVAVNGQVTGLHFDKSNWRVEDVSSGTLATEFYQCPVSGSSIVKVSWGDAANEKCDLKVCDAHKVIPSIELACPAVQQRRKV